MRRTDPAEPVGPPGASYLPWENVTPRASTSGVLLDVAGRYDALADVLDGAGANTSGSADLRRRRRRPHACRGGEALRSAVDALSGGVAHVGAVERRDRLRAKGFRRPLPGCRSARRRAAGVSVAGEYDVDARLAQGGPVVDDIGEYVRACQQLGYHHPDLTADRAQVRDWYTGEDGLRPGCAGR